MVRIDVGTVCVSDHFADCPPSRYGLQAQYFVLELASSDSAMTSVLQ
jgi:hypothetical protein